MLDLESLFNLSYPMCIICSKKGFIGKITACETIDDSKIPMTYTYYRDVKGGRAPRTAATYIKRKQNRKKELKR